MSFNFLRLFFLSFTAVISLGSSTILAATTSAAKPTGCQKVYDDQKAMYVCRGSCASGKSCSETVDPKNRRATICECAACKKKGPRSANTTSFKNLSSTAATPSPEASPEPTMCPAPSPTANSPAE